MNTKLYLDFIKAALNADGVQIADKANKIALKSQQITVAQYSAAARLIVQAYLQDDGLSTAK